MNDQEGISLIDNGIRQGCIIPANALDKSVLESICESRAIPAERKKEIIESDLLLVLSQDCDIANESERYIELIVASKPNARSRRNNEPLQRTRNLRKLHFKYQDTFWECRVDRISVFPKTEIFAAGLDWSQLQQLPDDLREMLITWRINRYSRAPLPDVFNGVFVSGYLRKGGNELAQYLENHRDDILDIYVYIFPDIEGAERYQVSITALLSAQCSGDFMDECRDFLLKHLEFLHSQDNPLCFIQVSLDDIPDHATHTLEIVATPEEMTMHDTFVMKRLSVDYLCFPD